ARGTGPPLRGLRPPAASLPAGPLPFHAEPWWSARAPGGDRRSGPRSIPPAERMCVPGSVPAGDRGVRGRHSPARREGGGAPGGLHPHLGDGEESGMSATPPLVEVENLRKHYPIGGGLFARTRAWVRAVDGVSFAIHAGETLGLVGESGCGKTTLGRLMLRLIEPTGGDIRFEGRSLLGLRPRELRGLRRRMQIIFQDPYD